LSDFQRRDAEVANVAQRLPKEIFRVGLALFLNGVKEKEGEKKEEELISKLIIWSSPIFLLPSL
jgi:hypothetical protein